MTLFLFLFSLPTQCVYSVDFFFLGWDFPVTCPQLEGGGSFSLLSNIVIFHFPKLFLHAIYSWWYWSSLVLFPSLKKRHVQLQAFHLSCSDVISFLLSVESNWKVITVSPPVHHFPQPPAVPPFPWQNLVLDLSSSQRYYLIPLILRLQLRGLLHQCCYHTTKAPTFFFSSVMSLSAVLVVFHSYSVSNSKWSSASPGWG